MSQPLDAGSPRPKPTDVTKFRQILLWPLFLRKVESGRRKPVLTSGFLDAATIDLEKTEKQRWRDRATVLYGQEAGR